MVIEKLANWSSNKYIEILYQKNFKSIALEELLKSAINKVQIHQNPVLQTTTVSAIPFIK